MSSLLRIWGVTAACIALLLILRGAFALALACFLLSPAPVLLFSHGSPDQGRLSLSWLRALGIVIASLVLLFVLVVYFGGLPQVHEWPGIFRGNAK